MTIANATANNTNNKVIFKSCGQSINYLRKINNELVDNAKDIDAVMAMYN